MFWSRNEKTNIKRFCIDIIKEVEKGRKTQNPSLKPIRTPFGLSTKRFRLPIFQNNSQKTSLSF